MTKIQRRTACLILTLAVLVGGCGDDDGGGGQQADRSGKAGQDASTATDKGKAGGVTTTAAALRASLTTLLQEHAFLSGITTTLVLEGRDAAPAEAALDLNGAALADAFGRVYGPPAGQRFLELWRQQTGLLVQFTRATAAGDQGAAAKAKADLELFKGQFAGFVNATNPQISAEDLEEDTGNNVNALLGAVTAMAKRDPEALSQLQEAATGMPRTGAILAAGIVKHRSKAFDGTADGAGATLLATFTASLQEHVYLTALTTRAVFTAADVKAARRTLDENSEGLSNIIGSVYGDPAARRFLTVWRRHVGALVDAAEAGAAKDASAAQRARAALDRFPTELGRLLVSVNPNFTAAAVAGHFTEHNAALLAVVEAQAAADPGEIQRLRAAAATVPALAELLAGGIARQFPTRFS